MKIEAEGLNNEYTDDSKETEETDEEELIIGLLMELAEENFKQIEQYTDYEHAVLEIGDSGKAIDAKRNTSALDQIKRNTMTW